MMRNMQLKYAKFLMRFCGNRSSRSIVFVNSKVIVVWFDGALYEMFRSYEETLFRFVVVFNLYY